MFGVGEEPDPRLSLANERTFLAWISAALGLISVGVGLESLGLAIASTPRLAASAVFIVAGLLCPAQAWWSWTRVERAMRLGTPLPTSPLTVVLTVAVTAAAVLVLVGLWVR